MPLVRTVEITSFIHCSFSYFLLCDVLALCKPILRDIGKTDGCELWNGEGYPTVLPSINKDDSRHAVLSHRMMLSKRIDPVMTCQSPCAKAFVPSVNYSASDSLVDILSGMAFSHANTPNAANKASRCVCEREPCYYKASKGSNTTGKRLPNVT